MRLPNLEEIKTIAKNHVPRRIGAWRCYSVLLPLVEKGGELHVLYEVRSEELEAQPGEVSFPGGAIEECETPGEAALRETAEELGLQEGAIELISELDYLVTYSNLIIYCFLGTIDTAALEKAEANEQEVKEHFMVPLAWLLKNDPDVYVNQIVSEPAAELPIEKIYPRGNYNWRRGTSRIPVYIWKDPETGKERVIWGMTARLTMEFIKIFRSIQ
jgi:8-oxo-dGTP pyrophosphatase MutT (NUDIX family)